MDHAVTDLLVAWRQGDGTALDRLFPLVYQDLRAIAHRHRQGEREGHTLGTTALVHEAYLRLTDLTRLEWSDRSHFFAVASRAMRRILVDYARGRCTEKRGAGGQPITLEDGALSVEQRADTLVALDEALSRLGEQEERLMRVVECRFFGGLTEEETGEALGITVRTVQRDWVKAKGWLAEALHE